MSLYGLSAFDTDIIPIFTRIDKFKKRRILSCPEEYQGLKSNTITKGGDRMPSRATLTAVRSILCESEQGLGYVYKFCE